MRILIIGAGWYGCHLGTVLRRKGIYFVIYEKGQSIFKGSSSNNQNRLHLGFHYPRSYATRKMCKENYYRFINEYDSVTETVEENIYLIASDSILDADTYKHIYSYEGYKLPEFKSPEIQNNKFMFTCDERHINHDLASSLFEKELDGYIEYNRSVSSEDLELLKEEYDYIFDCTNNMMGLISHSLTYEKTISLLYKSSESKVRGVTVMDGDFVSMYPYDIKNNLYSLTHVKYTPLLKSDDLSSIMAYEYKIDSKIIDLIEQEYIKYEPAFRTKYSYNGYFISYKAKMKVADSSRDLFTQQDGNVISFVCGKITGIFSMEDYVNKLLQ